MKAPAFLHPRPATPLSTIRAQSERNERAARDNRMRADLTRSFAERTPVSAAAADTAGRTFLLLPRLREVLDRVSSNCCAGRDAEMCGDLEDLERLVGEALRGAA